jgi:hypothetical protein
MMASRGKRVLIGCGIGCLGVVIIGMASCFGFMFWMNQPGELIEPELLMGSETTAHVEWTLRLEDPGTQEFVERLLARSQQESASDLEGVPPVVRSWIMRIQEHQNEKELHEIFPVAVAWTAHPGQDPDDDLHLFTVSIEKLGNKLVFADWMMGLTLPRSEEVGVVHHQGEKIYNLDLNRRGSVALFIRKNNIFFATDVETAKSAVERLTLADLSGRSGGNVGTMLAGLAGDGQLRGALTNEHGELHRLWRVLSDETDAGEEFWSNVLAAKLSGGFGEQGGFELRVEFRGADAAWAEANADRLGRMVGKLLRHGKSRARSSVAGEWVVVELEMQELPELFESFLKARNIRLG